MPGSGKTEAITYLEEKHHWKKVWFGQITIDEVLRRGLAITPENERMVREELRNQNGRDYYAKRVTELVDTMDESVVLVESLYMWTEYIVLKDHYGDNLKTIAIHASPNVRYRRLENRPERPLTRAQAIERDRAQIEFLEQGGPITMADVMIVNETAKEEYFALLDRAIEGILAK
jgi:dephospho-CoA kinase